MTYKEVEKNKTFSSNIRQKLLKISPTYWQERKQAPVTGRLNWGKRLVIHIKSREVLWNKKKLHLHALLKKLPQDIIWKNTMPPHCTCLPSHILCSFICFITTVWSFWEKKKRTVCTKFFIYQYQKKQEGMISCILVYKLLLMRKKLYTQFNL